VAGGLALARWSADVERWRIAKVRSLAAGAENAGQRPRPKKAADASDPGLWLDAAHAVAVLPVVLVTSVVTGLWWFVAAAAATFPLRNPHPPGPLRQTLYAGSAQSRIAVSLDLKSPGEHVAFAITLGVLLVTLPLVTRACVAVQAGLGQHHFDSRPQAAREALADAIVQAQEALEELQALSRGIAPPVLADRGLREALTTLAVRCTVPVELDAGPHLAGLGDGRRGGRCGA
jgi:hypothetical protein